MNHILLGDVRNDRRRIPSLLPTVHVRITPLWTKSMSVSLFSAESGRCDTRVLPVHSNVTLPVFQCPACCESTLGTVPEFRSSSRRDETDSFLPVDVKRRGFPRACPEKLLSRVPFARLKGLRHTDDKKKPSRCCINKGIVFILTFIRRHTGLNEM